MTKSATEVMQGIVFSAVVDSIVALKTASKGLPNTLLRDLNAVHANTTFADLPKEVQATIAASVRAAFTRLHKEGYSISSGQASPPRSMPVGREGTRQLPTQRAPHAKREGAEAKKQPLNDGRPKRKPKPRGAS